MDYKRLIEAVFVVIVIFVIIMGITVLMVKFLYATLFLVLLAGLSYAVFIVYKYL